jgi:pyruvate dehydrogenase E2 component (dihydrolipoamide acetyltransferase)
VDIGALKGSGPGGEVLADDILRAAAGGPARAALHDAPPAPRPGSGGRDVESGVSRTSVESGVSRAEARPESISSQPSATPADAISSIGRIMAERTTQSWTTVPHFFVSRDIDAAALNAVRQALVPSIERSHGVKITHTDLMVAAVARALRRHPRMNASWKDGAIALNADVNVALAMAVENAVVTAVIRNADRIALGDIARQRKELSERARANRLQPADIAGATFTISNLGMFGVDAFTAIIVPPQAGILAVGAITDRVVAVDGMIAVRPMVNLTLSSDHRVVDGARAAQFLADVATALREAGGLS